MPETRREGEEAEVPSDCLEARYLPPYRARQDRL